MIEIKQQVEPFDFTTSSTANRCTEIRMYSTDGITLKAASALEFSYVGVDNEDKAGQTGKTIPANTEWTIYADRRQYSLKGYFSVFVWSASTSVAVDGVAEALRAR